MTCVHRNSVPKERREADVSRRRLHGRLPDLPIFTLLTMPVLLISLMLLVTPVAAIWQENLQPRIRIGHHETDAQKFEGNSTHTDHFKLLVQDGETVLVGSRNMIYNISLSSLQENKRLEWYSMQEDVGLCRLKGKSEEDCHNYIRVLAKKSDDMLLVCGTNSFKPRCREYLHTSSGEYEVLKDSPGEGICPFDPRHNSTAVFAGTSMPTSHTLTHPPHKHTRFHYSRPDPCAPLSVRERAWCHLSDARAVIRRSEWKQSMREPCAAGVQAAVLAESLSL